MTPILIIKTKSGFALVEYTGQLPAINLADLECFDALGGNYMHDGLLDAVRKHFTPPPSEVVEPLKSVA